MADTFLGIFRRPSAHLGGLRSMGQRLITKAICKRIALCAQGKNGLRTLFKSKKHDQLVTLSKADMDRGELLTVVALPDWIDDDGDQFKNQEVLRDFAHTIISEGAEVDIEHDGEVLSAEQARITEVYMIQPTDERFKEWPTYEGETVDATGGVAVQFQIDDPELRQKFKDGEWDGVSLFGPAAVEEVDLKAASKRVAARMGGTNHQELDMTKEELQALLKESNAQMVELFKSALAPLMPKEEATNEGGDNTTDSGETNEPAAPVFKGDATNADDLAAYASELKAFEVNQKIAKGEMSADELATLAKSMATPQPSVSELNDAGIKAEDSDSDEVRALQVQLFKARKASNAPERKTTGESSEDELAKAAVNEGLAIAQIANGMLGNDDASNQGMRVVQG